MGFINRVEGHRLWHSFNAKPAGRPDILETSNLRAVQQLLGHTKMESPARYFGVELAYPLAISEAIEN